jgi:predicted nucleic acid-binding protein
MTTVVDASFLGAPLMPDESSERVSATVARMARGDFAAPALLQLECANLVLVALRGKRISPEDLRRLLHVADHLHIRLHGPLSTAERAEVLTLAQRHGLSGYDAAYLELAIRLDATLATLDRSLARAARVERLSVVP